MSCSVCRRNLFEESRPRSHVGRRGGVPLCHRESWTLTTAHQRAPSSTRHRLDM